MGTELRGCLAPPMPPTPSLRKNISASLSTRCPGKGHCGGGQGKTTSYLYLNLWFIPVARKLIHGKPGAFEGGGCAGRKSSGEGVRELSLSHSQGEFCPSRGPGHVDSHNVCQTFHAGQFVVTSLLLNSLPWPGFEGPPPDWTHPDPGCLVSLPHSIGPATSC